MTALTLIGSGWHPALFRSEAEALVGPVGFIHPRAVVTELTSPDAMIRLSRSALIDDVLLNGKHSVALSVEEISGKIAKWATENLPKGSFAIRTRTLGTGVSDISKSAIAQDSGGRISSENNPVNLDSPEHEIVVILAGNEDPSNHPDPLGDSEPVIIWGLREKEWKRADYGGRRPMERPFFQPVSLEPRLARLLISLGHRTDFTPTTIIDPFCGTGGIAIEAVLSGLNVLASDLDPRMVSGTEENLQWVSGSENSAAWDVQVTGVGMIPDVWGKISGAVFAFDPPYGRNAWKSDDGVQLLLRACSAAKTIDDTGSLCTLLPTDPTIFDNNSNDSLDPIVMGVPWSELANQIIDRGWNPVLTAPIKVHRSLARLLVVAHPSH
ncbi:MAG: hypothetical protein QF365_01590 [Candidatus Thalassarchaeaceae archaeon]|nr:hypothetical protein [Candidatus Thalassarchaeaceae archaeon]